MYRFCRDNGFKQWVTEPTRENHLLDLVISDMDEIGGIEVLPRIADHHVVRASVHLSVPRQEYRNREVWAYKFADWIGLRAAFSATNWGFIDVLSVDEACGILTAYILEQMREFIPVNVVQESVSRHPWLNERCMQFIRAKHAAEGTPAFNDAAAAYSAGILAEYQAYISRIRAQLRRERRGSKHWWRLANQIANRSGGNKGIPALKRDNEWILDAEAKANLLADTFRGKQGLPAGEANILYILGLGLRHFHLRGGLASVFGTYDGYWAIWTSTTARDWTIFRRGYC